MQLIGATMILVACTGIGFLYAGEILRRLDELQSLRTIAVILKGDIRYTKATLPEALSAAAGRHQGKMTDFLKHVSTKLTSAPGIPLSDIWKTCVDSDLTGLSLQKKDRQLLVQLGESLGFLDTEMQINAIDRYIACLEETISAVQGEQSKKVKLYRSLGMLTGILLVIALL